MERLALEAQQRESQGLLDSSDVEKPKHEKPSIKKTLKSTSHNSSMEKEDKKSKKKQKLYCVCRTPYDKAK